LGGLAERIPCLFSFPVIESSPLEGNWAASQEAKVGSPCC